MYKKLFALGNFYHTPVGNRRALIRRVMTMKPSVSGGGKRESG
jgi:hypothetical protein